MSNTTAPAAIVVQRDLLPALRENIRRLLQRHAGAFPWDRTTDEELEQFCVEVELAVVAYERSRRTLRSIRPMH